MRRSAEKRLVDWFRKSRRKPLVIRGARQVGKSTLVRQFARDNGLTLHEIDLERHLRLTSVFQSQDSRKIVKELEFVCGSGPIDKPGGLLFLDEIQAIPAAIQSLRYLYEDYPELPVIAAGSLLEFALSKQSFTMPVGRIEYLFLFPMTFEETLEARGEHDLLELLRKFQMTDSFPESAHVRLLELQRSYLLVGGMPEAVKSFVDNHSFDEVIDIQSSITETFRDDFAKYSTRVDLLRLHKIYDYVPAAVGDKFKYVRVDPHEQARDLRKALDLLIKAQVITPVHHTNASGIPLSAMKNSRAFKPFFLDCGLMNNLCGVKWISAEELQRREFINEGKMAEQFIAQHLICLGKSNVRPALFYWLREGRSTNAEVDFVIQWGSTVVPVEVKSGKSGSLRSLHQFVLQKKTGCAVRFDLNPPVYQTVSHAVRQKSKTETVVLNLLSLPLYMVEQLTRLLCAME